MLKIFFLSCLLFNNLLNASNGNLSDNFRLTQLTIVGAHNAAMSKSNGWLYAQQSKSLDGLFDAGARFFKVPIQWYDPSRGIIGSAKKTFSKITSKIKGDDFVRELPVISICHESPGDNNCKLSIVQRGGKTPEAAMKFLKNLAEIAARNPREVIILKLESYLMQRSDKNGTSNYTNEQVINQLSQLLVDSGVANRAFKLVKGSFVTLGQIRNSNKNIILFVDDQALAGGIGYLNLFSSFVGQTHWETERMKDCQFYKHKVEGGLTEVGINPEASIKSNSVPGEIMSLANKVGVKTGIVSATDYKNLNSSENVQKRIDTCESKNQVYANILSSDNVDEGDLRKIADQRNAEMDVQYKLPG